MPLFGHSGGVPYSQRMTGWLFGAALVGELDDLLVGWGKEDTSNGSDGD